MMCGTFCPATGFVRSFDSIAFEVGQAYCNSLTASMSPDRILNSTFPIPAPYEAGIEKHKLDGVAVRIYSREKTLADCFKHRHEIGLDTVLEAVRMYKAQGRVNVDAILRFASVCRVARVAGHYLESLL